MLSWASVMFFALLCGHALADFGWQSEAMAAGKNRHSPAKPIPKGQVRAVVWPYWMVAHALIHAGVVWFVTRVPALALAEFGAHVAIDVAKCEGWTTPHQDQALHVACKVVWVAVLLSVMV